MPNTDPAVAVREFFLRWLHITERMNAVDLLGQLPDPTLGPLAMALARAVHDNPGSGLERLQALALVVVLLDADTLPHDLDPADPDTIAAVAHDTVNGTVRGIVSTRQQAAFAAVRQLGTAAVFGVDPAVETELSVTTSPAAEATLDLVERIAADRHRWFVREHDLLGWVLFHAPGNGRSPGKDH
jgi:hypothetical protein